MVFEQILIAGPATISKSPIVRSSVSVSSNMLLGYSALVNGGDVDHTTTS